MAAELEEVARRFAARGNPQAAADAKRLAELAIEEGIISLDFEYPDIKDSLSLTDEWLRQSGNFIGLGFHNKIGMEQKDYEDSLPEFTGQPEQFKGRFDIPLLVETRIPVKRQSKLAGMRYDLGRTRIKDADLEHYSSPEKPYVAWVQDGSQYLKRSANATYKLMDADERGGTAFDGIAFFIAYPGVLKNHAIGLPGSQVGSAATAIPVLDLEAGNPVLVDFGAGAEDKRAGHLTCGMELVA